MNKNTTTDTESKDRLAWWSSSSGHIELRIPEKAIADCSHSGACDGDVAAWQPEIDWSGVTRNMMIAELSEYGAWTDNELSKMTVTALRETILWLACGSLSDQSEPLDFQNQ